MTVSLWAFSAQTPPAGKFSVYGDGNYSCGVWLESRKSGNISEHLGWVEGFLSGVGSTGRKMKDTDGGGVQAFVDQYCDAHRLDTIATAVGALVRALAVKAP